MHEVPNRSFTKKHLILALLGIVVLAISAAPYWWHFVADDTMISLRYSQRLLEGKGLTWNDGEYVEGYSNFLWVMLTAGMGWAGMNLLLASRVLAFITASTTLVMVIVYFSRRNSGSLVAPVSATALLATSLPLALWGIGGLEQPLVAALLMVAIAFSEPLFKAPRLKFQVLIIPALALSGLCLTRPDGPLFTVAFCLALIWNRGINKASIFDACLLALIPFTFYFGQVGWRLWYYGEFVPNTAFVKVPASLNRIKSGASYLVKGSFYNLFLVIPALWAASKRYQEPIVRLMICIISLWCTYLMFIGGDIFTVFRHFVPILAPLAILAGLAAESISWRPQRLARLGFPIIAASIFFQALQPVDACQQEDAEVLGRLFHKAFKQQHPLIAVNTAGAIPFFSKLPTIDMLGLNDAHIARQKASSLGKRWLAHDHADADYVMRRRPDLIVLGATGGGDEHASFPSDVGLLAHPQFREVYHLITVEGREPHTFRNTVWVRKHGGALGIKEHPGQIHIPGYHFASNVGAVANLDRTGQIGAELQPGTQIRSLPLALEAGFWSIEKIQSTGELKLSLINADTGKPLDVVGKGVYITAPTSVSVQVVNPARHTGKVHLFDVYLQRR